MLLKVTMKRLTEEMVIARTKISDLSAIKRLNCWGSELTDVSLLRRMTNVEVLSLSINKIDTLVDFQCCRSLQELYIRQNNIKDLNEVCYLQELTNLKNLWLGENPCANVDGYRLAVLRALPQLQKLDDIAVTPEEISDANRRGLILQHPDDIDPVGGSGQLEYYHHQNQPAVVSKTAVSRRSTPEISPTRCEPVRQSSYDPEDDQDYYNEVDEIANDRRVRHSPNGKESPPRRYEQEQQRRVGSGGGGGGNYSPEPVHDNTSPVYYDDRRNYNDNGSPKQSRPQQQYDKSPLSSTNNTDEHGFTPDSPKEERIPQSSSVQSIKDYSNGDRYQTYTQNNQEMGRYCVVNDGPNGHMGDYQSTNQLRHSRSQREVSRNDRNDRCDRSTCNINHQPPFHRRPVTRNSNILSAVLCLVKELDYPGLEVVEMAIRCRMDELQD